MKFANASHALVSLAAEIQRNGALVEVRGELTRELRNLSFSLSHPLDRNILVTGRRNNIFASIAESVWVLAGRNDLAFLTPYVPRAPRFSDDGMIWRAGYGPRLRSWQGVDQLEAVRHLLANDPTSRRAVMSIFDPAVDFVPSKDIPCTNWLSFSLRDGVLDLAVAIRSNDLVWGFSGINSFEWSLVQEVMAFWLGAVVGELHFFATSMHIYDRHFERADEILAGVNRPSAWSSENHSAFSTPAEELEPVLGVWFELEAALRADVEARPRIAEVKDPLLSDYLRMLDAFWTYNREGRQAAEAALTLVNDQSLVDAGMDYFAWTSGDPAPTVALEAATIADYVPHLIALHAAKDKMYGDSWKRRGEQMAVLANLARKVDRLVKYGSNPSSGAESWFDTAVDLFVYAVKYKTFLLDAVNPPSPGDGLSDGAAGFQVLLDRQDLGTGTLAMQPAVDTVAATFQRIEDSATNGEGVSARLQLVDDLIVSAARIVEAAAGLNPERTAAEVASWTQ